MSDDPSFGDSYLNKMQRESDKTVRITRRVDALIPGPPFTPDELRCLIATMYNSDRARPDRFFTSLHAKLVKMLADMGEAP